MAQFSYFGTTVAYQLFAKVIRMMKSRRMKCAGHVARMGRRGMRI
jgi:hypothetical protein